MSRVDPTVLGGFVTNWKVGDFAQVIPPLGIVDERGSFFHGSVISPSSNGYLV